MLTVSQEVRLANRLHTVWAAWAAPPDPDPTWATLEDRLCGVARVRRLHRLAVDRGFRLAAPLMARDLAARVAEVRDLLGRILVENRSSGGDVPDPVEWGREVRHLEDEFGRVEVRWGDAAVRVVTDPIRLDGIDLGRFAVEFHWKRMATRSGADCFDVIALDPNPAAGRRDVTHPHVRDGDLCAGDAERPLDRAIRDGRLGDAFVLVRSVLGTYNPDSPHVPLADWDGFACGDCGRTGRPVLVRGLRSRPV